MTGDGQDKPGDLTVITAAAAAALGVVASLSAAGVMQRVLRNHGQLVGTSMGAVLFGASLWLIATLVSRPRTQRRLRLSGVALFVCGIVGSVAATVTAADDVERPSITASFDREHSVVKARVTAGNIPSSDSIVIGFDGLTRRGGGWDTHNLSVNYVGPDEDGHVRTDLEIMVSPGRYDAVGIQAWNVADEKNSRCEPQKTIVAGSPNAVTVAKAKENSKTTTTAKTKGRACVVLPLPTHRARPLVTTSWEAGVGKAAATLAVEANAADLRHRLLVVRVVGRAAGHSKLLGYHVAGPTTNGTAKASLRVPVAKGVDVICVEGRVWPTVPLTQGMACPVEPTTLRELHDRVTMTQLLVPQD